MPFRKRAINENSLFYVLGNKRSSLLFSLKKKKNSPMNSEMLSKLMWNGNVVWKYLKPMQPM